MSNTIETLQAALDSLDKTYDLLKEQLLVAKHNEYQSIYSAWRATEASNFTKNEYLELVNGNVIVSPELSITNPDPKYQVYIKIRDNNSSYYVGVTAPTIIIGLSALQTKLTRMTKEVEQLLNQERNKERNQELTKGE